MCEARRIKWCLSVLVIVSALCGGCGPIWYLDPGFSQRLAKQENKPLLLYFKAWDSTQHRNMKLRVFEHPPVKHELLDTINLELEFAWFPDVARRYRVQGPQVCVMCAPDGKKVHTTLYVNPVPTEADFLDWLRKAKAIAMPKPTSAPAQPVRAPAEKPEKTRGDGRKPAGPPK